VDAAPAPPCLTYSRLPGVSNGPARQASSALGFPAHARRLRVFRAPVVAGAEGLTPSVLADQLDVTRNALSFHLKELAQAGLVTVEQQGRNLIYRADFSLMNGLLDYLAEYCCQGGTCEVTASAAPSCSKALHETLPRPSVRR